MDKFYIRRCLNGRSFVASATPDFKGLEGKKCPFSGDGFETVVKEIGVANAEIMGINYEEALTGVQQQGIFFGKFKINLGETMIL
ncbi:MAG: hypothetical protein HQK55_00050 [Deltaproteobacteria bacterium]|nr:hypothetical protein [Deltaproteobacteria bacterium]